MAKFTLIVYCDNAAFRDGLEDEISACLEEAAAQVRRTRLPEYDEETEETESGFIRDSNGNSVGRWEYNS